MGSSSSPSLIGSIPARYCYTPFLERRQLLPFSKRALKSTRPVKIVSSQASIVGDIVTWCLLPSTLSSSVMEELKSATRRLTKRPPPALGSTSFDQYEHQDLQSQRSSASLQRSASTTATPYARTSNPAGHVRTGTTGAIYTSSNTSLDRQAIAEAPSISALGLSHLPTSTDWPGAQQYNTMSEKSTDDLVGAPFDGSGVLSQFDTTKASGYQNALRRPPPPPLSHTAPADPRSMTSPTLRSSQSFYTNEKSSPRNGESSLVSPKRYSDETKDMGKLRKKSGFSNFMNSIGVGSPRKFQISAPENPVHVTHVGYDAMTGQFTVRKCSKLENNTNDNRVYLRNGIDCSMIMESRKRTKNKIHKPLQMSSTSTRTLSRDPTMTMSGVSSKMRKRGSVIRRTQHTVECSRMAPCHQ